jgi:hypothetical protein
MELIAALDEAEGDLPRAQYAQSGAASSKNTATGDAVAATPKLKRMRSSANLDQMMSPTTSSAASLDEVNDTPRKRQMCRSCRRAHLHDRSYITPNALVEWASVDGRVDYCRVCHNTWRLCLQHVVPLSMLPLHIAQSSSLWNLQLVASLSLRMEGRERVDCGLVHARVELLHWFEQFTGVPIGTPFVVRPLAEVTTTTRIKSHFMVTIVSEGKSSLG